MAAISKKTMMMKKGTKKCPNNILFELNFVPNRVVSNEIVYFLISVYKETNMEKNKSSKNGI